MGTISDKLTYLNTTKGLIKDSINLTGAGITNDTFRSYANKLKLGLINALNDNGDTIYSNLEKVSGKGSNLSLTPTYEAPMRNKEIYGNTSQTGTPTPSSPIPIESVTGEQNVEVCGKNLLDLSKCINGYINSSGEIGSGNDNLLSDYIEVESGKDYTISLNTQFQNIGYALFNSNKTYISRQNNNNKTSLTISIPSGTSYIRVWFTLTGGTTLTPTNILQYEPMIEQSSTATTYEAYNGNTYEVNLKSKNVFDCTTSTFSVPSRVNVKTDNNTIIMTTTETTTSGNIFFQTKIPDELLENGETYTISSENVSGVYKSLKLQLRNKNGTSASKPFATQIVYDDTYSLYVVENIYAENNSTSISSGTTAIIKNVMVEKGSTATSYSPYFTPIELNKIGDYQDSIKKSTGKNLYNKNNVQNGYQIDANGNIGANTNYNTSYLNNIKSNTTYSLSLYNSYTSGSVTNRRIAFYDENNNYLSLISFSINSIGNYQFEFTTPANASQYRFTERISDENITINEGSTALPYEPYGKVWYIEKQIGKVVLDGSENWIYNATSNWTFRYTPSNAIQYTLVGDGTLLKSNYFTPTSSLEIDEVITAYRGMICMKYDLYKTGSANDFKTWLSTHNTEVDYVLATPTYTTITNTELIEDLETLYNAKSKNGTTNIVITSEDLSMIMSVNVIKGDV